MSWLIKFNLPEASSKVSITVPTVRKGPDVLEPRLCMRAYAHTHTNIYAQTHHGYPKAQGRGEFCFGFPDSPGEISFPVTRKITFLCQFQENTTSSEHSVDSCPDPRWRKAALRTRLITFVTVIIQESNIKSLPVQEL